MSIISNKLRLALFLLLCSSLGFAQGSVYINQSFSATGTSTSASSINGAVDTFMLQYYTTGTPGAVSIQMEGDNGSGSFTICGAAVTVTTSGQGKCVGNYKQVRINLTSLTGGTAPTVVATLVGNSSGDEPVGTAAAQVQGAFATGTAIASAGNPILFACDTSTSGTVTAGQTQAVRCNTAGQLELMNAQAWLDGATNASFGNLLDPGGNAKGLWVAPFWYNGTTADRFFYCSKVAKLNALAAATTQIVALSGATKIKVCSAVISNNNATATTLKMVEGTGANCGTGTADLTALMNIGATSTAPVSLQWGNGAPVVTTTGGDALCFTSSAASSLEITITYSQF